MGAARVAHTLRACTASAMLADRVNVTLLPPLRVCGARCVPRQLRAAPGGARHRIKAEAGLRGGRQARWQAESEQRDDKAGTPNLEQCRRREYNGGASATVDARDGNAPVRNSGSESRASAKFHVHYKAPEGSLPTPSQSEPTLSTVCHLVRPNFPHLR